MTKNSTKTMRYLSELRERVMSWSADGRLPGKYAESTSAERRLELLKQWPENLSLAVKAIPLNLEWATARARSAGVLGAAAALAMGAAVVGTAHQAQEADLQRTSVVSEAPAGKTPADTAGDSAEPASESGEAPAEPAPEAPAEPAPEAPAPEAESGEAPVDGQGSTVPVEEPAAEPVVEMPPATVPLDELRVTSPFGWRLNPLVPGAMEFHNGIDFGAVTGTPVKAAAAGTVTYAEYHQYGGLRIVVDHGDGTETTYNHLSGIYVEVGQHVDFNQVIGGIGSTGNSTGPHLHFEVIRHGEYIDPAEWLGL